MTRFSELTNATKMCIVAVLVLLIGVFAWHQYLFTKPSETFWAAVNNNLQTQGVTRHLSQENQGSTLHQYLQLQLGQINAVSGVTTIERQQDGQTVSKVVTEEVGLPQANYSRYTEINVPQQNKKNVSLEGVKNQWAVADLSQDGQTQSTFSEIVYGVLPYGRLNQAQRQELMDIMQDKKVYSIDYSKAKKETVNGRQVYRYSVSIAPEAYITMLQRFDQMMNLKLLNGVDPTAYASSPPFEIEMLVDVYARQLVEVVYTSDPTRKEQYSGYGFQPPLQIPEAALQRADLEQKLSKLLQ